MLTIEELKELKKNTGYTNEMIARLSGVPIGTVQKIFAGITKRPRYDTLKALDQALTRDAVTETSDSPGILSLKDSEAAYHYTPHKASAYQRIGGFVLDRQGQYTIDDFEKLPEDGHYELIDGVIYDMATTTFLHQILIGMIFTEFMQYKYKSGNDCWPVLSPFDVRLDRDDRTMIKPDLMVLCADDRVEDDMAGQTDQTETDQAAANLSVLQRRRNHYHDGAPRFVMEVISPSSRRRDLVLKLNKYMDAGVYEYWIVDPDQEQILVYDFKSDNYPDVFTFQDKVPVAISGGELSIDFAQILDRLR
ncbi:MAG: Uma2 family endonuclease [Eubacterium sp.]|nr:Uma2 family endonuclease [Eubacterium sp.]